MSGTNTSDVSVEITVRQRAQAQAEKYLDNILNFRPITSSKQSFSRFLDIFVSSAEGLKVLDVGDLAEYILYSVAMRKLDFKTRSAFENVVNQENMVPSVKELVKFVEKQHLVQDIKQSVNTDKIGIQQTKRNRGQKNQNTEKIPSRRIKGDIKQQTGGENGNSTQDATESETPDSANKSPRKVRSRSARYEKLKCFDCETNNHSVENCEMFLNLSNDDRISFAMANKICFACLNPGHSRFSCPHKNDTCVKCSSRHHVMLHTDTKKIRKFLIFRRVRNDIKKQDRTNKVDNSTEQMLNGFNGNTSNAQNCIICDGEPHIIDLCDVFHGYDPKKRLDVIKKNRLCVNCFGLNHMSRRCPVESNCDQCKLKHHAKIHEAFSRNRQNPENCILCNDKYHNLNLCDIFNSYDDPEKRLDVTKKNRLCANCFEPNHMSRRCPVESNCDQCKLKHHAKVHEAFSRNRQNPENCILCNDKYHNLDHCDIFNSYDDPEKRVDVIKKNRLCANCFEPNHMSRRCPVESNCDQCKLKHHAKVHEAFSGNRQNSISKRNGISNPENCILCNDKYHNLDLCDIFNSYDNPEKRLDVTKKNRLCANCFEPNHMSRRCPVESNCDQCKLKHHAKVHEAFSRNRQNSISKRNGISNPENCILCNDKYHNLDLCDIFNSYDDPEKCLDVIKKNRLCANCFEPNHTSRRCPVESNCDQCKAKHHAKVHLTYKRGSIKRNGNQMDCSPHSPRYQPEIAAPNDVSDDTKSLSALIDIAASALNDVNLSN
ncbi:hypothetical protein WDU94_013092 [Cyamophila willieti]